MRPLHLESCNRGRGSLAFVGFIQAEPKAVMGKRPHSWANRAATREKPCGCRVEEEESYAWEQARATFIVWWPNTDGSEAEGGQPQGPRASSGMSPETQGRCL